MSFNLLRRATLARILQRHSHQSRYATSSSLNNGISLTQGHRYNHQERDGSHTNHERQGYNDGKNPFDWFSNRMKFVGCTSLASVFISYRGNYNGPPRDNNINNNNNTPILEDLRQAILEGDERRVKFLARKCTPEDINTRHDLGWQMLHTAAVNGRATICETLIQHGADINGIDHYSSPRIMAEARQVDPLVVALIRDTEFNPDLARANFYGCTPLHYAAWSNSPETIEVLMKYGANPTIKNELGYPPSKFANPSVANTLRKYEQDFLKREKQLEDEERRKYPLEKRIKDRIVGQEAAISMVAATIRRKENGWFDENHPLVFLFLGSSGIGKTELAKQVAKYIHKDNKHGFIRLDMSEYQEKHSVARVIGSPPGYVGYQDGGQLTDALKKCPNAVVLFDEVEKAHPEVLTILLQLFDEGRLTDGKGETIECKDAIFIMTSNLASEAIAKHAMQLRAEQQLQNEVKIKNRQMKLLENKNSKEVDGGYQEQITISRKFKDTIVRPVLKFHFKRDEFLGRINEMVYFLPFSDSELKQLVTMELNYWAERAKKNNKLEMTWDDSVVELICKGYDIHYGARSIKHEIERRIINQISELHHGSDGAKKIHITVIQSETDPETELINIKIS